MEIRLAWDPRGPRVDHAALRDHLEAEGFAVLTAPWWQPLGTGRHHREGAVVVVGDFTPRRGVLVARILLGWLSVHAGAPVTATLAAPDGRTLELVADTVSDESGAALAEFLSAGAEDAESEEPRRPKPRKRVLRPDDKPVGQGDFAVRPSVDPAPPGMAGGHTVRNTPPGPPFGDEDDDEW